MVLDMKTKTSFRDLYSFPGFRARARFKCGIKGDQTARVVELARHQKKTSALFAGECPVNSAAGESTASATWMPGAPASIWILNTGVFSVRIAA